MSRIVRIEQELDRITPADFQGLCDMLLSRETKDFQEIFKNGSVSGKSKTKVGTPDTAILQTTGRYILAEYTTNISSGLPKIKEDIQKCLDYNKTGIEIKKIDKIIICSNFKITSKQRESLTKILEGLRVNLLIYDLQNIAIKLYHNHNDLLSEYLKIVSGKGQVVNINKFKEVYSSPTNANIAIFANDIIGRKNDLKELAQLFTENRIVIITGKSGIGKTRLALDAMERYCDNKNKIIPCCLSYKNDSLIDDFEHYFDKSQKYLLLVDDANRLDSIQQLMSLIKDPDYDNVALCMTVRDYAVYDLQTLLDTLVTYKATNINPLDKESIEKIISNPPFNIENRKVLSDISRLADGNPRLALMAANLYLSEVGWNVVNDSSEIYKKYFNSIVTENKRTFNRETLQTLGLISFFYSIVLDETETLNKILKHFTLTLESFHRSIELLNRLEMIQMYDNVVKIPDQNLSSYFFYKCFIEEQYLDFSVLVKNYFKSHLHRLKDSVISINNMFGATDVCNVIRPILKEILNDENIEIDKYDLIFTFYWILKEEATVYLFHEIENLEPEPNSPLTVKYEQNSFTHSQDSILRLIKSFFLWPEILKEVLQLSLNYVAKRNSALPELTYHLKQNLMIRYEDHEIGYYRQHILIDLLTNRNEQLLEYRNILFYELSKDLLSTEFRYIESHVKGVMSITSLDIPPNDSMRNMRNKIWQYIDCNFKRDKSMALDTISTYPAFRFNRNLDILNEDLEQLFELLSKNVNVKCFNETVIIYNLNRRLKLSGVKNNKLDELVRLADSPLLKFYEIMNWRWLGSKSMSDFDYYAYDDIKKSELNKNIVIKNRADVTEFLSYLQLVLDVSKRDNHRYEIGSCTNVIIANTAEKNAHIGLELVIGLLSNGMGYICNDVFVMARLLLTGIEFDIIESRLKTLRSNKRGKWELALHIAIKEEDINRNRSLSLINSLSNSVGDSLIFATQFLKYIAVDKLIYSKIFKATLENNEKKINNISLFIDFFDEYFSYSKHDIKLLQKVYKEQSKLQQHFDYNHKGLLNIVNEDPTFLLDFISDASLRDENGAAPEIWDIPNIEIEIGSIFPNLVKQIYFIGFEDHLINIFFRKLDENKTIRAKDFLLNLIDHHYKDTRIMNGIVAIAKNSFDGFLKTIMHRYLKLNSDKDFFFQITWISTNGIYSGNSSSSDRQIRRIQKLMKIIDEMDIIKLLPIKIELMSQLDYYKIESKNELRRRFADPFNF